MRILVLLFFGWLQIASTKVTYQVIANRLSDQPILSKASGSYWDFNYNAALFTKDGEIGLVVRVQNWDYAPFNATASYLATSRVSLTNGIVSATPTTSETFKLFLPNEACGTEDPRITFHNGIYYLFYTAYDCHQALLSSAISTNPFDTNSWMRLWDIDLPKEPWSKSGAALFAAENPSLSEDYLFWGDSSEPKTGISIALGIPGKWNWNETGNYLLEIRPNFFDSKLVESGPSPLKLNTGDFLFIYNSAREGFPSEKPGWNLEYNIGYAVLAGNDPTDVLQRSDSPIMSPELDWEIGNTTDFLTPNVVFLEGLIPDPNGCKYANLDNYFHDYKHIQNAECFFGVYGGADSVLGAVQIIVSSDANITHPSPSPSPSPTPPPINYKVVSQKLSTDPILSHKKDSAWEFNYNAALFNYEGAIGMLVRVQNLKDESMPFYGGNSYMATSTISFNEHGQVFATPTTPNTYKILHPDENCGTKDPRIALYNDIYYLFYTGDNCNQSRLVTAISSNPFDTKAWVRLFDYDLPNQYNSQAGAALFATDKNGLSMDYLFWGDSITPHDGIGIAVGTPGKWKWNDTASTLLKVRLNSFDSWHVEAGSPPLQLNTGDFFFVYNSARDGHPSAKPGYDLQYNLGYAVLSGQDPTKVIDRSAEPLLSPTLSWEIGNASEYLTPNVVFLEGLIPDPNGCKFMNLNRIFSGDQKYIDNAECFFGVYGGADTDLGAVEIIVSSDANIPHTSSSPPASSPQPSSTPIGSSVPPPVSGSTASVPTVSVPTMSVPTVSVPTISVPTISVPTVSVPTGSVPTISMPTVSLPSVSPVTPQTVPTPSGSTTSRSSSPPPPSSTTPAPPQNAYQVRAIRLQSTPILSSNTGSEWEYNCNGALFTNGKIIQMLVEVRNSSSGSAYLAPTTITYQKDFISVQPTTINNVMPWMPPAEACGTEDPRVTFNNGIYYLFYTANDCKNSYLSSAISATPDNPNSWVRYPNIDIPNRSSSKSGAALFAMDSNNLKFNFLFWGDSASPTGGIGIAIGKKGIFSWTDTQKLLMAPRPHHFDSLLVEAGPSPLQLRSGDYFFVYNSAQVGFPSDVPGYDLQYNLGYAILNQSNPTQVLERSDSPLLTPYLDWEIGNHSDYFTSNKVYMEGLIPDPLKCGDTDIGAILGPEYVANAECFFGIYSGADSALGALRIVVSTKGPIVTTTTTTPKPVQTPPHPTPPETNPEGGFSSSSTSETDAPPESPLPTNAPPPTQGPGNKPTSTYPPSPSTAKNSAVVQSLSIGILLIVGILSL